MPSTNKPGHRALRKGRYSQPNGIYLVTTVTEQRIPWFQVHRCQPATCRVGQARGELPLLERGVVVGTNKLYP